MYDGACYRLYGPDVATYLLSRIGTARVVLTPVRTKAHVIEHIAARHPAAPRIVLNLPELLLPLPPPLMQAAPPPPLPAPRR